jgi:hypothetical protein
VTGDEMVQWDASKRLEGMCDRSDPLLFDPFLEVLYKNGDCLRVTCNPPGQGREQFCVERTEERGTMENPDERSELLYQGNERDVLEWLSNYGRTGGGK